MRRAARPWLGRFIRGLLPAIDAHLEPARMLADVEAILRTDRWVSFDRFHETSATIGAAFERGGAAAEITPLQTGLGVGTGRWIIPETSDVVHARAELVEPERRPLLDYHDCPWHIARWSNSTPAGGVTAELVVVDTFDELNRIPRGGLTGKIVLARMHLGGRGATLADKGVAAVLIDPPVADLRDAVAWTSFGWGGVPYGDGVARPAGLVISRAEGDRLRALLKRQRVVVHADVQVRRYQGNHDVVSGLVRGLDPDSEVWVVAHSGEPGAADNAAGVAVEIAAAEAIEAAIAAGELPRPKRTIRLLSGYECYGFFAYLERIRRYQPPLAGLVVDVVGLRPELCSGRLEWHDTVPMSASFVDELGARLVAASLARRNPGYRLYRRPFVSTSDTLLGDPKYGFPCPWLATYRSGRTRGYDAYHSSADTPELLSPEGLATCALSTAAYLYYLADADTLDVLELARGEAARAEAGIAETTDAEAAWRLDRLRVSYDRLQQFCWGGDRRAVVDELDALIERVRTARGVRRSLPPEPSGARIPRRTAPLSPTLENTPPRLAQRLRATRLPDWALFWADGRRDLATIAARATRELGRDVRVDQIAEQFEALAQLEYVAWLDPDHAVTAFRLRQDLRALGLAEGMDVLVHSSLSALGPVLGGAETVVDVLLEVLGPEGTLLMPSFNHTEARLYNPAATPTNDGAIPDAFWRRAGVLRSDHPTHAVAACGPRADAYLCDHAANGIWSADSPIGRLIHGGGYVLSLGVGHSTSTAYHVAEIELGVGCLDSFGSVDRRVEPDGSVVEVRGLAWRERNCPVDPAGLDALLAGRQKEGRVGDAQATLAPAMEVWKARRRQLQGVCEQCRIRPQPRIP